MTKVTWAIEIADEERYTGFIDEDGVRQTKMVYFVRAYNQYGQRFAHCHLFDSFAEAESLVRRIEARKGFTPVLSQYWEETYPVYGSDWYCATGGDAVNHADIEPEFASQYR